jgi:hypothetical protein
MAMKKTHDAVYAGEKYQDRQSGEEKTRYINMGVLFTRDDGSLTCKVEILPVGFNGWINFYPPKEHDNAKQASRAGQAANQARGNPPKSDEPNDDIPW